MKTEHNGAKNGGGYWGTRLEAKERSRLMRRNQSQELSRVGVLDYADDEAPLPDSNAAQEQGDL